MNILIGFFSICSLFIFTFEISRRWPGISKIIFTALLIRLFFLLINNYFFYLPDGDMDAISFETKAWEWSQKGFLNVFEHFRGPDAYFLSVIISIPYSLLGRSILLAQSMSIFFGICSVFLGWLIAKKIWGNEVANKAGWVIAMFPSLISYSVLTMREVYITFFLLLACYGIITWIKKKNLKSLLLIFFSFTVSTFFHGGLVVGLIIFVIILIIKTLKSLIILLSNKKINLRYLIVLFFTISLATMYFSNKISIPYLGNFKDSLNIYSIKKSINDRMKGDSVYPEWTIINSDNELIYKIPLRALYFLVSPLPSLEVKKLKHAIGYFDALLYLILIYLIFQNRKQIMSDPALKIILIILLAYFVVFGIGTSNFGTAIRHRSKFVIELILLAAPLIPRLKFLKKKNK